MVQPLCYAYMPALRDGAAAVLCLYVGTVTVQALCYVYNALCEGAVCVLCVYVGTV